MLGITKVFPGIKALDGVDFSVERGEIHALLGENGAGKSTLMSVLFGLYVPDGGIIQVNGEPVQIRSPNDATALKIGMVHQHFKLVHNFSVTENIILGKEITTKCGNLDIRAAERRIAALIDTYGLACDPASRVENLSVGMRQRVEILKILYRDADILIFDEPTAVLTPQEIDELLLIFEKLKSVGKTIVFITHKLHEIKAAAGLCTVLRRGKLVGTVDTASTTTDTLAQMMVGRKVNFMVSKKDTNVGNVVLSCENLTVTMGRNAKLPVVSDLSLEVRRGEIVGIAGVDGNGQSELAAAISGTGLAAAATAAPKGAVKINGADITKCGVRRRVEAGLGFVPEDRQRDALVLDFRLDENMVLKSYYGQPFSRFGFLKSAVIKNYADRLIKQFDVRSSGGAASVVRAMSGGNQQKALIAREIDRSPDILVICQPTRGLDIGAIEYIHGRIIAERDGGRAILLISFELDEIIKLCDRIAVISKGTIIGIVDAADASERDIGAMMGGERR
jgi:simple sugar transport system ATP-binding protein